MKQRRYTTLYDHIYIRDYKFNFTQVLDKLYNNVPGFQKRKRRIGQVEDDDDAAFV